MQNTTEESPSIYCTVKNKSPNFLISRSNSYVIGQARDEEIGLTENYCDQCKSETVGFLPFSAGANPLTRKAGLLTYSGSGAFPILADQWQRLPKLLVSSDGQEFTAAGTVADFHGIPF